MEMAKARSFQSLGGNVYRVGGAHRSAITGRYISNTTASRYPNTSVTERRSSPPEAPTSLR